MKNSLYKSKLTIYNKKEILIENYKQIDKYESNEIIIDDYLINGNNLTILKMDEISITILGDIGEIKINS